MNQTLATTLCFILPCIASTLGSLLIFFFNKTSKKTNSITIGLASGIMLSASIWSLMLPAMEYSENLFKNIAFLPVSLGFVLGCLFMVFLDQVCQLVSKRGKNAQNIANSGRVFKFFAAITIHNIPEGLCVGFAIGSAIATNSPLMPAVIFAVGIAFQNIPESLATALPLYHSTKNKKKAFFLSFLSGAVEPICAILGFFLASNITILLPWLLSFSGGTMIYVIFQELLPDFISDKNKNIGIWSFIIGFIIMMILDTCL